MEQEKAKQTDEIRSALHYTIDVIIPVYHADEKLDRLLTMLYRQTIRPSHVFLLHTIEHEGQGLDLPVIEGSNITIHPVNKADFDHGGTRRYGASLSNADILMFMTQDAVPADECLVEKLLEAFSDPWVSAAYARQLSDEKVGLVERYTRNFNYPKRSRVKSYEDLEELGIKTFFCSNVCAMYRNSVYQKLGGFVEKTIFNEDMLMAAAMIRADYRVAYVAEAKVVHSHKYTYRQQFTRNFDLGVSHRQYREVFAGIKSESEGIRLVKNTVRYLCEKKKYHLIPDLIISSGFKFLGYQCGKHYELFPVWLVKKCSMNRSYWD